MGPRDDIAFLIAGRDLCPQSLFALQPDGTGQRLLSEKLTNVYNPTWSAGGAHMAFDNLTGSRPVSHVWFASSDGEGLTQVNMPTGSPAWSPDGGQLACESPTGIYIVDVTDGKARLLARNAWGRVSWRAGA